MEFTQVTHEFFKSYQIQVTRRKKIFSNLFFRPERDWFSHTQPKLGMQFLSYNDKKSKEENVLEVHNVLNLQIIMNFLK